MTSSNLIQGKCETCGQEGEVAVACSGLGPVSLAYCAGCLHENAEPLWLFEVTYDMIGAGVADHVKAMKTVGPSGVMTWNEFVAQKEPTQ